METEQDPLRNIPAKRAPAVDADIGSTLKAARLKRKDASLEAIAQRTRIPRKYLEALEANRLEQFPALAYLRGFLKGYCDYLEIEFEPLWLKVLPDAQAKTSAPPRPQEAAPERSPLTFPLLAIAAMGAVIGLWLMFANRPRPLPPPPPALPARLQPPQLEHLTLLFRRDLWLSVSIDGRIRFQGRVPRGSRQRWLAKKSITLRSSDPAALRLMLDGKPFALPPPTVDGAFRIEAP
ncbi:MAG: DUF4115 domain-containing protein [Elusimicrobia bacterium]|nr:DUF4115 domain-containing protein [Elusimicrobiota bacterium]MDE2237898.1 DUF4115 domain-containing protein [Elusimicrobiota bacterium]MDE2425567.1 DUF4115 domain-containing protein [Elusimicrobiota bacterium]